MNFAKSAGLNPLRSEEARYSVRHLNVEDISEIARLENLCWMPRLRADESTLSARFQARHISLGAFVEGQLVGVTSFLYTQFDPNLPEMLPSSFHLFSSLPMHPQPNSAFVYNLNMHPRHRGEILTRKLIFTGIDQLLKDNIKYLVGASRCPSYNGNTDSSAEKIVQSTRFRQIIDASMLSGSIPSNKMLSIDPVVRFYRRTLHCDFMKIVPNFLPGDLPSGGFGIYFCKSL